MNAETTKREQWRIQFARWRCEIRAERRIGPKTPILSIPGYEMTDRALSHGALARAIDARRWLFALRREQRRDWNFQGPIPWTLPQTMALNEWRLWMNVSR